MLTLIFILVVIWLGLMGLLAAWSIFLQGYIYTSPTEGILWRAPVAGTVVTLYLALWVFLDYRAPGQYREVQGFSSREDKIYPEIRILNQEEKEEVYKRTKNQRGQEVYKKDGKFDGRDLPSRPMQVIITENGEEVIFEPERDARGQFKVQTGQPLQYKDKKGRVMVEGDLGRISEFRTGNMLLNLLLNFLHLVVWVAVFWLVLQFRFFHALGLALVFWVALTLFLLPPTLGKAEEVAQQRAPVKTGA